MYSIRKDNKAIAAPGNYKKLKPMERIEESYPVYAGSGIPIKEIPLYDEYNIWIGGDGICGHCNSKNTLCIYFSYSASNVDKSASFEVECRDCGKFTLYSESL